jgi:chitinase
MRLGGTMWLEISMDKSQDESLVGMMVEVGSLEGSENHLSYPLSEYENLREGMSDYSGSGSGSKGDSEVATSTALGVFTSFSSSSTSPISTTTGSGSDGLEVLLAKLLEEDGIIS